mmetsp:Transcript_34259/g.62995  ORF Transcript_34259/g.62995 Transcript_34259/m.62995 type:complete len:92 (-) Transcript_34259:819-1094(-)
MIRLRPTANINRNGIASKSKSYDSSSSLVNFKLGRAMATTDAIGGSEHASTKNASGTGIRGAPCSRRRVRKRQWPLMKIPPVCMRTCWVCG